MAALCVDVKLFGPFAQRAGKRQVAIQCASPTVTCAELRRRLADAEPSVAGLLSSHRFAVNCEFADEDQVVRAGDEVALVGMVCGG